MPRWTWRRATVGVCVLGLLGLTSAGAPPKGDPLSGAARASDTTSRSTPLPSAPLPQPDASASRSEKGSSPYPDVTTSLSTPEGDSYVAASYTRSGIPKVALRAYRHAAELLGRTDPTCQLHWSLLAAIGRVESNHGRHGDSALYRSGQTKPPITGPVLDGSGATARIADTDGGRYDGDSRFDRAVGPMQFIPSTWKIAGVDGNGDGQADPHNVFDAALSAGRYLCAGDVDLSVREQLRDAVHRYNHSTKYVNLVLRLAEKYRQGDTATRQVPPAPDDVSPPAPLEPPEDKDLPPASSGDPPPPRPDKSPDKRKDKPADKPAPNDDSPDRRILTAPHADKSGDEPSPPGHSGPEPQEPPKNPRNDGESPGGRLQKQGHNRGDDGQKEPGDSKNPGGGNEPGDNGDGKDPGGKDDGEEPGGDKKPDNDETPEESQPPALKGISPSQGTVGSEITLTGRRLQAEDISVSVGGESVKVTAAKNGTPTFTAPTHAKPGEVKVAIKTTQGSESFEFKYLPQITGIEPASGSTEGGDEVTVTGTSLQGVPVHFGKETLDPKPCGDAEPGTCLTLMTPAREKPGEATVTVGRGQKGVGTATFSYNKPDGGPTEEESPEPTAPTVTKLSTSQGAVGSEVTISGNGLEGASAYFGEAKANVLDSSPQELVVEAPPHARAEQVDVSVRGEQGTPAETSPTFSYVPKITDVEPTAGSTDGGGTLELEGSSLEGATVRFGAATPEAKSCTDSGQCLAVTVPPTKEPGQVEVKVESDGHVTEPVTFTYHPPDISLTRSHGQAGKAHEVGVTAEYTEFAEEPKIAVAADEAGEPVENVTIERKSDTKLVATLPQRGPGKVTVTVIESDGDTLSETFTYRPVAKKSRPAGNGTE